MLEAIVAILAGILLLSDLFHGKGEQFVNSLRPYEVAIGVAAVVIGILHILSLFGIALIMAGLILAISALSGIPRVGPDLARAGKALTQFRTLIGIVVTIFGVLAIL